MADLHRLREALSCQRQGDWRAAEILCRDFLRGAPEHPDGLALLGLIEAHHGKLQEGSDLLRRAALLAPANPGMHFNLGLVLQERGMHEEALATFDTTLSLRADVDVFHQARGIALKNLGRQEEALASYDAALKLNPRLVSALNNRGVVFKNLGRLQEAVHSYRAALALNPKSYEIHNNLGIALHDARRHDEALATFLRAASLDPSLAQALMNAGVALHELRRYQEAHEMLLRAQKLQPQDPDVLLNLGNVLAAMDRTEEALAQYQAALAHRPDDADIAMNIANTLRDSGRHEEALPWYDRALATGDNRGVVRWNRALSLLAAGDYEQGWQDYEARFVASRLGNVLRSFEAPQWTGREDIAGRTVLLHAEQGLGDTIQYCRYARLVSARGAHVVLEAPAALMNLMASLQGVAQLVAHGDSLPPFDFHCPLLSLPLALGTRVDTIPGDVPYLHANQSLVAHWRQHLAGRGRPQIGVAWSGNAGYWNDHRRSIPLEQFQALLPAGADYWSLQRHGAEGATPIHAFEHTDFDHTAAQICALDAVISVDTSIGHLAGALGRPLWLLLSKPADARWMEGREDSPWYPSARLLRQPRPGDWASVFARIDPAA